MTATPPAPSFLSVSGREESARAVQDEFVRRFDRPADGVWSAPGRVNLLGEHVDYQSGLCLPMAIEHRCRVAAARTDTGMLRIRSLQADGPVEFPLADLKPGAVDGWGAYPAGVAWALERFHVGRSLPGADLLIDSEVPLGAGLSSSAALECAVAVALDDLFDLQLTRQQLVDAAAIAETQFVGAPTGGLDQSASLLCTEGHALLLDCQDFSTRQVQWDLAAEDLALLIVDTRTPHRLSDGEAGYAVRRRESEDAAAALGVSALRDVPDAGMDAVLERLGPESVLARRARHILTEIGRVANLVAVLDRGEGLRAHLAEVGSLLNASHDSLRDDYEVTCPELDVAVASARAAGAHGARMTGGGFGGSIIALVDADQVESVASAILAAFRTAAEDGTFPPAADGEEHQDPAFFVTVPSAGAGKDL